MNRDTVNGSDSNLAPLGPPAAADTEQTPLRDAGLFAAVRLLAGTGPIPANRMPLRPQRIAAWVVPLGLAVGVCWMGVFRGSWRLFGDPEMTSLRAIPALAVVLLECLVTGTTLIWGLAQSCDHVARARRPATGEPVPWSSVIVLLAVLSLWVLVVSLPAETGWYPPEDDWKHVFNPLFPLVIYRPLVLAPLWGRWAFLLAAGIGRTARDTDPLVRAFCRTLRPARLLRFTLLPVLLTGLYTNREGKLFEGLVVVLLVLLATYLAAVLFARSRGGQTRETIGGCGAVAQLVFLAAYRALCV